MFEGLLQLNFAAGGSKTVKVLAEAFNPDTFDLAAGGMRNVAVTRTTMSQESFQVKVNVTAGKSCGGTAFFLVSANK